MRKPLIILASIMILIVGILTWWFSDAQVIKRQTQKLASSLTIAETDGKSARLGKTQDFSNLLADSVACSVDIDDYKSDFRHDDLQAAHHMMAQNCSSSSAKASNIEIEFTSDTEAKVEADLTLLIKEKDGTPHGEACDAVLIWKKDESGEWKLDSISILGPDAK